MKACEQCQYRYSTSTATRPGFCSSYCETKREEADRNLETTESKVCHCGTVYYRPPGVSKPRFAKRKACSIGCATAERHRKEAEARAAEDYEPSPEDLKTCRCGTIFVREPGVTPSAFAKRKVCSHKCAASGRKRKARLPEDTRTCGVCGEDYDRPKSEPRARFARRKACSRSCAAAQRSLQAQEERESEDVLSQITDDSPEADALRYYLQYRRDRMREKWERELWQAMLTPSR